MSKRAKQRRQKPGRAKYNRETHGQGMCDFMEAFDDDSLPDGAWQAMLEEGGEAWAEWAGVHISGYEAFMEYVRMTGEQQ